MIADDRSRVFLAPRRPEQRRQDLADGRAVDAERVHDAEVRLHQDADGVGGAFDGDPARAGADAGLEVAGDQTGAGADGALGDLAAGGLLDRLVDVLGADVAADGVVQPRIVTLADQRDDDVVLAADLRRLLRHPLDGGVGHLADGHRVRQQDRRLEQSPLLHLRQPGDLAGAIQDEAARQHAVLEDVRAWDDGGDAGAHRALPTSSGPSPMTKVVCPTRTPATSVIALESPTGKCPMENPRSRRRALIPAGMMRRR